MRIPNPDMAEHLLKEASRLHPGQWVLHNRVAGDCAFAIASRCPGLNPEAARILGLLHDIGRRFGTADLRHVYLGHRFMMELGFADSARICLSHSFPVKDLRAYIGNNDCTDDETTFMHLEIEKMAFNEYDTLIQLCDAISLPEGPCTVEKRLVDVVLRHGFNDLTVEKWKAFLELKKHFENRMQCGLYEPFDNLIL